MNRDNTLAALVYLAFVVLCGVIGAAAGLALRWLLGL